MSFVSDSEQISLCSAATENKLKSRPHTRISFLKHKNCLEISLIPPVQQLSDAATASATAEELELHKFVLLYVAN